MYCYQVVSVGGGTWKLLYQRWLAQWLKDDNIPLHLSLKLTFTLLQYVQVDSDVQLVFTDLSKVSESCFSFHKLNYKIARDKVSK